MTIAGERTPIPHDPLAKKGGGLDELYQLIGEGCRIVERVQFPWGEMWLDENGKLTGQEVNREATRIFHKQFGAVDVIVGNVVLRVRKGRKIP